jgi:hypothetical protein
VKSGRLINPQLIRPEKQAWRGCTLRFKKGSKSFDRRSGGLIVLCCANFIKKKRHFPTWEMALFV